MHTQLLDYLREELLYLRDASADFANDHPKIAHRLHKQAENAVDPYVERLIEAFCLMAARIQVKRSTEFPRFVNRLLDVLCPDYVAPMPSVAVAQLRPNLTQDDLTQGHRIPRGTALRSTRLALGEQTYCQFTTSLDVTLWPLAITEARLTDATPNVMTLANRIPLRRPVRGVLWLRMSVTGDMTLADLEGLDRLPIYLAGDVEVASHLFELLHVASMATLIAEPEAFHVPGQVPTVVTSEAITHVGLGSDESLLPLAWTQFHGHALLREYFACPERFFYFSLNGLQTGLRRIHGKEVEIAVLLDRPPQELAALIDVSRFALFCTPVINLFTKHTDRIELRPHETEFHVVPARLTPLDYEVFSVTGVYGESTESLTEREFRPLYATRHSDRHNYGRYFSVRREPRVTSDTAQRHGTRTAYVGTEVFLSLVDQHQAPYGDDIRFLAVEAMVTNRDLAMLIPRDGHNDLTPLRSAPVASIGLIRAPTPARTSHTDQEAIWRLIRQIHFNTVPLESLDHRRGGQSIRDLLRLYLAADDQEQLRQVESVIGLQTQFVTRQLSRGGPLTFLHGAQCTLTVDESGFSGSSPYLFGLILEHYLAHRVSMNSFTQMELHSIQRGAIGHWPMRLADRGDH